MKGLQVLPSSLHQPKAARSESTLVKDTEHLRSSMREPWWVALIDTAMNRSSGDQARKSQPTDLTTLSSSHKRACHTSWTSLRKKALPWGSLLSNKYAKITYQPVLTKHPMWGSEVDCCQLSKQGRWPKVDQQLLRNPSATRCSISDELEISKRSHSLHLPIEISSEVM